MISSEVEPLDSHPHALADTQKARKVTNYLNQLINKLVEEKKIPPHENISFIAPSLIKDGEETMPVEITLSVTLENDVSKSTDCPIPYKKIMVFPTFNLNKLLHLINDYLKPHTITSLEITGLNLKTTHKNQLIITIPLSRNWYQQQYTALLKENKISPFIENIDDLFPVKFHCSTVEGLIATVEARMIEEKKPVSEDVNLTSIKQPTTQDILRIGNIPLPFLSCMEETKLIKSAEKWLPAIKPQLQRYLLAQGISLEQIEEHINNKNVHIAIIYGPTKREHWAVIHVACNFSKLMAAIKAARTPPSFAQSTRIEPTVKLKYALWGRGTPIENTMSGSLEKMKTEQETYSLGK